MKLGIDKIPPIILDNTDRNRTSPFAFTGNKFEFRAVGSTDNPATPMTILNTIVAEQLTEFYNLVDKDLKKGTDKRLAIVGVLRKYIKDSKAVRFEGDGYSEDWVKEAKKRGLANVKDTPRALDAYLSKKSRELFAKQGIMNPVELEARNEIQWENYIMKIQIESRVMADLVQNHIIPTAIAYQNKLIQNAKGLKELGIKNTQVLKIIESMSGYIETLEAEVEKMTNARKKANVIEDGREKAIAYCDDVKGKYFESIRYAVDKLELIVDDEDWPLVKYREMLFLR